MRNSPETMRKLCFSTKYSYKEIKWYYGILHRDTNYNIQIIFVSFLSFSIYLFEKVYLQFNTSLGYKKHFNRYLDQDKLFIS